MSKQQVFFAENTKKSDVSNSLDLPFLLATVGNAFILCLLMMSEHHNETHVPVLAW